MTSLLGTKLRRHGSLIVVSVVFSIYAYSMFVYPWSEGGWFDNVQKVWYRWQSLNVGVLAFIASYMALYITTIRAQEDRDRKFIAERALLSHSLSDICDYLQDSMNLLKSMLKHTKSAVRPSEESIPKVSSERSTILVIRDCIYCAPADVASGLAEILEDIQVNDARLNSLRAGLLREPKLHVGDADIFAQMMEVAELYALVGKMFPIARGQEQSFVRDISKDDVVTAFRSLDTTIEGISGLLARFKMIYGD